MEEALAAREELRSRNRAGARKGSRKASRKGSRRASRKGSRKASRHGDSSGSNSDAEQAPSAPATPASVPTSAPTPTPGARTAIGTDPTAVSAGGGGRGVCRVCGGPRHKKKSQCPGRADGGRGASKYRDRKSGSRKAGAERVRAPKARGKGHKVSGAARRAAQERAARDITSLHELAERTALELTLSGGRDDAEGGWDGECAGAPVVDAVCRVDACLAVATTDVEARPDILRSLHRSQGMMADDGQKQKGGGKGGGCVALDEMLPRLSDATAAAMAKMKAKAQLGAADEREGGLELARHGHRQAGAWCALLSEIIQGPGGCAVDDGSACASNEAPTVAPHCERQSVLTLCDVERMATSLIVRASNAGATPGASAEASIADNATTDSGASWSDCLRAPVAVCPWLKWLQDLPRATGAILSINYSSLAHGATLDTSGYNSGKRGRGFAYGAATLPSCVHVSADRLLSMLASLTQEQPRVLALGILGVGASAEELQQAGRVAPAKPDAHALEASLADAMHSGDQGSIVAAVKALRGSSHGSESRAQSGGNVITAGGEEADAGTAQALAQFCDIATATAETGPLPVVISLGANMAPGLASGEAGQNAEKELVSVLRALPREQPLLIHGYRGGAAWALNLLRLRPNLYFSFCGAVTHTKLSALHEFVYDCPLDRFVLCSDATFYPPKECAGAHASFSQPLHCALVARRVAELKRLALPEVLSHALENTRRLFAGARADAALPCLPAQPGPPSPPHAPPPPDVTDADGGDS